jgi:hypothetical protein
LTVRLACGTVDSSMRSAFDRVTRLACAGFAALLFASCGEECPEGSVRMGDACVFVDPFDAGSSADAGAPSCDPPCSAPAAVCDPAARRCVECTQASHCSGETICDVTRGICVQCSAEKHCPDERPVCDLSRGLCVECATDAECIGELTHCTDDLRCVACVEDAHCTSPEAAHCGPDDTCVPCTTSAECDHLVGLAVCETEGPMAGTCVECTETDDTACGANVCRMPEHACSEFGGAQELCESCDTDGNCAGADVRCIETHFEGTSDWRCLQETLTGSCTGRRPYPYLLADRVSRSEHPAADYCAVEERITCDALLAYYASCESEPCPAGARCRPYAEGADVCVFECEANDDCPRGVADEIRCVGDATRMETSCRTF